LRWFSAIRYEVHSFLPLGGITRTYLSLILAGHWLPWYDAWEVVDYMVAADPQSPYPHIKLEARI
jgi:hypothetical protein